ncbi:hypothetical protein NP233_g12865 [Leucocoprinus birnbaumii]|uniref:Uncharacterized protein n=1 Tax=Leucocoprinus birnbaumii TaxID=56174 RepID=A0AAD5YPM6_9AGAR|nr:hypothetical protein NP233_g12865 [Leucocoprinus birnbaumii]
MSPTGSVVGATPSHPNDIPKRLKLLTVLPTTKRRHFSSSTRNSSLQELDDLWETDLDFPESISLLSSTRVSRPTAETALNTYLTPTPQRETFVFSAILFPPIHKIAHGPFPANKKSTSRVSDDTDDIPPQRPNTVPSFPPPSITSLAFSILRVLAYDRIANSGKSNVVVSFPTTKVTQ